MAGHQQIPPQEYPPEIIKAKLKEKAAELGFDAFGVSRIDPHLRKDYYLQWIAEGKHGEMRWMERNHERRLHPENILPGARSILCLGMNYYQPEPPRRGRIAKYALGEDYHKLIYKKLKALCRYMREEWHSDQKPYVDTGPVLEKPIAALAGIGWQGKHTVLIHPQLGTWLFLGVIFTTLPLPADTAPPDRCGQCTRCLNACPTQAITAPYQLNSRRCIAYLTIEHPGSIPEEFRQAVGDRLFGCDVCLDVCPWNRWARLTAESKFAPRHYSDLREMLSWDEATFEAAFAGTPIKRTGLRLWKRNICVVLGNIGTLEDVPALLLLVEDKDPLLSEHAQWACQQIRLRQQSRHNLP